MLCLTHELPRARSVTPGPPGQVQDTRAWLAQGREPGERLQQVPMPLPTGTAFGWAPGAEPDFRGLQRQARAQLQNLATLPPELRDPRLGALQ